jgi:hypothetical protein
VPHRFPYHSQELPSDDLVVVRQLEQVVLVLHICSSARCVSMSAQASAGLDEMVAPSRHQVSATRLHDCIQRPMAQLQSLERQVPQLVWDLHCCPFANDTALATRTTTSKIGTLYFMMAFLRINNREDFMIRMRFDAAYCHPVKRDFHNGRIVLLSIVPPTIVQIYSG